MPIRFAVFFALVSFAATVCAQPVERTVSFPASPFQTYNALTVEWQLRQWSGAVGVNSDARPGGVWRLSFADDVVEEGTYLTTERGEKLDLTLIQGGVTSTASLAFEADGGGTKLTIQHEIPGAGKAAQKLRSTISTWWDQRLQRLADYLNNIPGGYMTTPPGGGTYPAVLVLHDRFGLDRTVRGFCDSLSARGYVALAVDMFRGEATSDLTTADRYVQLVSREDALEAARKGLAYLRKRENVDRKHTAVWGMGFGGGEALRVGVSDAKLKGCVAWHPLDRPADSLLSRMAAPVLLIFADPDVADPHPAVSSFVQSLVQAGVRVENRVLPGSGDFSDPSYGEGYNAAATADSWRSTLAFLDRQLRL